MAVADYFGLHCCRPAAFMQQVCSGVGDTGTGTRAGYHATDVHGFPCTSLSQIKYRRLALRAMLPVKMRKFHITITIITCQFPSITRTHLPSSPPCLFVYTFLKSDMINRIKTELCKLCVFPNETRWLYCVECPQYSTRFEASGYLYVSSNTVSPALRPNSVASDILIHPAKWSQ